MTSNPKQPMSNGTPGHRRARGIFYANTKICNSMLAAARSGFDAGFNGMQVRDRRYPVRTHKYGSSLRTGATASLDC